MITSSTIQDTVTEKITDEYNSYKKELDSLDTGIALLKEQRESLLKNNLLLCTLYKASQQFDIQNIVLNQILVEGQVFSRQKIETKLQSILNIYQIPEHVYEQLAETLRSGSVLSCGSNTYKLNTSVSCSEDDDNIDI